MDAEVPFDTAEMTAKNLPNCRLIVREGEHFSAKGLDQFIKKVILSSVESR